MTCEDGRLIPKQVAQFFEAELPFTVLHELCRPMLRRLDSLPEPQRTASSD